MLEGGGCVDDSRPEAVVGVMLDGTNDRMEGGCTLLGADAQV